MDEEKTVNLRHIQFPNSVQYNDLNPVDCLVYVAIKSFDGKQGCFPSLKKISEFANIPLSTIRRSISNLAKHNIIKVSCAGRGQKTYYTFPKPLDLGFEPFSYEFAQDKDLSPNAKGYLIMTQKFMSKNSEESAAIVDTTLALSNKLGLDPKTVRNYEKELIEHGILTIAKSTLLDEGNTHKQIRYYNLSKYFQAIAYTLRVFNERLTNNEMISQQLVTNYNKLKRENQSQSKTIEVLQRELKELKDKLYQNAIITL